MMTLKWSLFVACAVFGWTSTGHAFDVKTPAPVIYLADNLDEADGLGWCIDTQGRGLSDRLHAHSCKPQGGDVQFRYDAATGQIASVAFEGLCAARPNDPSQPLRLIDCDTSDAQRFDYDTARRTFHPAGESSQCLSVGDSSRSAGPFMSRDLAFLACADTPENLRQWIVKP